MTPQQFTTAILNWFDQHGRKDLPWQRDINPYRVWVSEIMLQQTQVSTVIPYYQRFMESFPDIETLASATEDKVLSHWSGLGYYARGRNLHKTAKIIQQDFKSVFPDSVEALSALPGIGRSTAGAILSIAYGERAPILDGNVKRVLSRYFAIEGWAGQSATAKQLWEKAEHFTPDQDCAKYTQAIMDLGATLCTRSSPQCNRCPLQKDCAAFQTDRANEFPQKKPKKAIPTKQAFFLILQNPEGRVLLEKRPPQGIWGGLWSLPQHEEKETLLGEIEQTTKCIIKNSTQTAITRHTFSHFHLELHPILALTENSSHEVQEADRWGWFSESTLNQIGLAAPIKKLLISSLAQYNDKLEERTKETETQ